MSIMVMIVKAKYTEDQLRVGSVFVEGRLLWCEFVRSWLIDGMRRSQPTTIKSIYTKACVLSKLRDSTAKLPYC